MPENSPVLVRQNTVTEGNPYEIMNVKGGKRKTKKNKKQLFTLKKGDLTKYGYHISTSNATTRHKALGKARKHYPHNSLIRKLNALAVLHKNRNPIYTKRARSDMNFLRKKATIKAEDLIKK
jgi:hypothetical protein